MNKRTSFIAMAAALLLAAPAAIAQNEGQGTGQSIVTVLPKNSGVQSSNVAEQDVHVLVDGKSAQVTQWQNYRGDQTPVELVLMIDNGARESLGRELSDITHFIQHLPPNVKVAVAYMEYGRAVLAGPLTANHARAAQEVHLPAGIAGVNASPYFCLSDIAKHWPSSDLSARREVIMLTDGVDYYELHYDPNDPYVLNSIQDATEAHLVVYAMFWHDTGFVNRTGYEINAGQNLLSEVTAATGGNLYWIGFSNPVSLTPWFDDFTRRLENQYELGFTAPLQGKARVENLKVKIHAPDVKVTTAQQAYVTPGESGQE